MLYESLWMSCCVLLKEKFFQLGFHKQASELFGTCLTLYEEENSVQLCFKAHGHLS